MRNYVRNILIFVVTFSLVFGLCIIPSYASNEPFALVPKQGEGTLLTSTDSSILNALYYNYSESVPVYAFAFGSRYQICVASEYNTSVGYLYYNYNGNYYTEDREISISTIDTDIYRNSFSNGAGANLTSALPYYDTIDNAITALRDYIDNGGGVSETTYNAYFDIPCGNVAYIKTGNDNTLTLSCTMPEFSKLTGSTGTYWTNTMQIAYGVPSYPPAGTTFPLSSMSDIQWFRSTEGRDLLGRTKKALFLDTTQSSDNFIVIYNPTYRELTMSGQGDINSTIRVQCSALIDYHMYSLTGEYNSQGTISSYSIDGFSDPYVGTPTSDNENVQGTNSTGATPNIGGSGNEIGGTGGIIEYVQGIQNTLDNFANSFISLLKAPISHIQSLISSGTDYFNVIRGLYGWLPDEVQGTINSAMIVSISVGVIALLL